MEAKMALRSEPLTFIHQNVTTLVFYSVFDCNYNKHDFGEVHH